MGLFDGIGNALFSSPDPYGGQTNDFLKALQAQMMGQGQRTSAAQMQNNAGFGKAIAGQQAMAASARPGYEGMAQRQAAQNVGALQANQAVQGSQIGLQEQEEARRRYMEFLMALRQQQMGQPTGGDRFMGAASGAIQAGLFSDERLKTDIDDGGKDADEFIDAIRAKKWRYKDGPKHGEGKRLGVMAQDIERAELAKHAVLDTPEGKMIDTAKIAGPVLAAIGRLGEKVKALEAKRKAG